MKDNEFWRSLEENSATYNHYWRRLVEMAVSRFEWKNLPPTVDPRFMEISLFNDGMCVFFKDDVLGFLGLRCVPSGLWNVYNIPIDRRAYASNSYQKNLTEENSVIIYNNFLRTGSALDIREYAQRLYDVERAIDINVMLQKTPVLIQCDEKQRLTLVNLFKKYEGNVPFIYANKKLDLDGVKTINLQVPFVAQQLQSVLDREWNDALTYLGISNIAIEKKERLITDEVDRHQGGVIASRNSALEARRQACRQINEMFGLDVWVDFRGDVNPETTTEGAGIIDSNGKNE